MKTRPHPRPPLAWTTLLSTLALVALQTSDPASAMGAPASEKPGGDGWVSLFDGKTLAGWTDGSGKPPGGNWVVEDGVLFRASRGGNLLSKKQYRDFELEFEWKIAAKGNSGLKYRFTTYGGKRIGAEYQMLDDVGHGYAKDHKGSTASLYDVIPPDAKTKRLNPPGEYNHSRVVARGDVIEHYLNGALVMKVDLSSDAWKAGLAKSKFRGQPDFATRPGHILLQDHGHPVWFRKILIREGK